MDGACTALPQLALALPWAEGRHSYQQPLPWLKKSLLEVLESAVSTSGATKGTIRWPGFDELQVEACRRQGAVVPIVSHRRIGADARKREGLCSECRHMAGPMLLVLQEPAPALGARELDELARAANKLLRRHELYTRAARSCKVDIASVVLGETEALSELERAMAKVAKSDLPVLIEAEFGSDVAGAAAAVHCQSARRDQPFVIFGCAYKSPAAFRASLAAALENAAGGSILLCDVNTLCETTQRELLEALTQAADRGAGLRSVRLFSATTQSLDLMVKDGRFCPFLRAQIEFLKIEVPPLRVRKDDIGILIEHQMRMCHGSVKSLSDEAKEACERYRWAGNLTEMKRVVSRLVVMSEKERISMEDLAVHTPFLVNEQERTEVALQIPQPREQVCPPATLAGDETEPVQDGEAISRLAACLSNGNHGEFTHFGSGVQRALAYVSQNYQTEITLADLAANAYLSVSHLSFLLKKSLGIPFKTLLAYVRVEKAKQLLAEDPGLSVTEVSLSAGFGDLSHFERTFKRIVGMNPREFRRRASAAKGGSVHSLRAAGNGRTYGYEPVLQARSRG